MKKNPGAAWRLAKALPIAGATAILVVAAMAFLPSRALASEWYLISKATDGTYVYLDISTLRAAKNHKKIWGMFVKNDSTYRKVLTGFRCAERESANFYSAAYDESEKLVSTTPADLPQFEPVIPDSIGETILEIVCSSSPKARILKERGIRVRDPREHWAAARGKIPILNEDDSISYVDGQSSSIANSDDEGEATPEESPEQIPPPGCVDDCAYGYKWAFDSRISSASGCPKSGRPFFLTGCREAVKAMQANAQTVPDVTGPEAASDK
ncbi:MAG TPA: surface-adhesin E family protein [Moraxellaceae bacterium]|nr:surface-adhesin E family protein [Moraxellaceae bacterium]